ncbi:MAG: 2-phosphosulfolactate phosphatase [Bacteroidales bacterium]|nr:2-phosphosulfolactate phosphatase [Bacteroidales bacterium]
MSTQDKKTIEVCFSPVLYPYILNNKDYITVIIDVLRATTSICAALNNGATKIIPVAALERAKELKEQGFTVAAERNGIKSDFADLGNSPFNFSENNVKGKDIVYSTTNGTMAIEMAMKNGPVIILSFNNLSAVANFLFEKRKNVLILCAGWKNKFNLEDSVCAGALVDKLCNKSGFAINCDAASASLDLWKLAKSDLSKYMEKALHRHRLKKMGLDDVLPLCFSIDTLDIVPVLKDGAIVKA